MQDVVAGDDPNRSRSRCRRASVRDAGPEPRSSGWANSPKDAFDLGRLVAQHVLDHRLMKVMLPVVRGVGDLVDVLDQVAVLLRPEGVFGQFLPVMSLMMPLTPSKSPSSV